MIPIKDMPLTAKGTKRCQVPKLTTPFVFLNGQPIAVLGGPGSLLSGT